MKIELIQQNLQILIDKDFECRQKYIKTKAPLDLDEMKKVDNESTIFIKTLLKEIGLPTISKVGQKASFQAWKLVQHSADQSFQEEYLTLMEQNLTDVNKKDYAYLKDRVLLAQGKQQIYGTQFKKISKGVYESNDLFDATNVDERRKQMDLDTLEENIERMRKMYD